MAVIIITFKVDDEEDLKLAAWLKSFNTKQRERSVNIRQALRTYINSASLPRPVTSVIPRPKLEIEVGEIKIEKLELSEAEISAKLDNMF